MFLSAMARPKKQETSVNLDWAEKLVESDQGSYFDQDKWLKELNKQPCTKCDLSDFFIVTRLLLSHNDGSLQTTLYNYEWAILTSSTCA